MKIIDELDFLISSQHISKINKCGLSFFELISNGNTISSIALGSLRGYLSKNKGTVNKYLNKDHCLDREDMREEMTKKGVEVFELGQNNDKHYFIEGNVEVARGLGFFDNSKKGSKISNKAEYNEVKLSSSFDFILVSSKPVHKKVSVSKMTYLVFASFHEGLIKGCSLEDTIKNAGLLIMSQIQTEVITAATIQIFFFKDIINKFKDNDEDYFENCVKSLKFSSLIEEVEVSKNNLFVPFTVGKENGKVEKKIKFSFKCC